MATREEITCIRDARAGKASAQLALGKRYLFGSRGLQKNLKSSLYWLGQAASRSEPEAWLLIGYNVPYETAMSVPEPMQLCEWYERAFDAGVVRAGLVWARMLLKVSGASTAHPRRAKALSALETAAAAGFVEAQWELAQELQRAAASATSRDSGSIESRDMTSFEEKAHKVAFMWTACAASNGLLQAQRLLAEQAWARQDRDSFVRWALPAANTIAQRFAASASSASWEDGDAQLLSRCGRALLEPDRQGTDHAERFLKLAATAGDKDAQFALGMWHANMDEAGKRISKTAKYSNYIKAVHWLTRAGEQGVAKAWYALHRICLRPNIKLPQHVTSNAQHYLELAAERGDCDAQLELGTRAWRNRNSEEDNDVRAVYWLQKAAFQGSTAAGALLQKIAGRAIPAKWAQDAQQMSTHEFVNRHPLLAARIKLAALFGLSISEALMIDINAADYGHCLVVDIRKQFVRGKRRLIRIETGAERAALTRMSRDFVNVDCGPGGPEGNYRKRLYLFDKLFSHLRHISYTDS